jgi:hypothetical protein
MVITKPFDAHQLVERIDALLARTPASPAASPREEEAAPFETLPLDDTLPVGGRTAAPTEASPFGPDHDFSFSAPSESREQESAAEPPWVSPEGESSRPTPAASEEAPPEQPASEPPALLPRPESAIEEISASDAEILFDVPFEPGPLPPGGAAPAVPELTEAQIDAIAARVVQKLSDRVVREIAWDVVPDLAERAVLRRIEQLESEPD